MDLPDLPQAHAVLAVWMVWVLSWLAAAAWSRRPSARAPFLAQAPYRIATLAGALLLLGPIGRQRLQTPLQTPLWTTPGWVAWALVGLAACGFAFCWWARIHLGVLWSGTVTRKEGHRIVDTGPYGLVRHPIYTGMIAAAAATCAILGTAQALVGLALLTFGCWLKARLEESFLRAELGAAAYDAYARRTPMLIPGAGPLARE